MAEQDSRRLLLERTLEVWQPRTCQHLTEEDARQIVENAVGFVTILRQWDTARRASQETPPTDGVTNKSASQTTGE